MEHMGLSEVEAVEYVLMLSRDEANANAKAGTGSGASDISETHFREDGQGVFEGDFNIEDTRKDTPQGKDKATRVEIPFPAPGSFKLASTSARNIPLSAAQNYGQRRASNISNFSSPSTSISACTAPRNAWTSGGPSLSARISPSTTVAATGSLHHHYQQQQGGRRCANSNMDMDEDLRHAIELSLVEARNRGEDV